MIDCTKFKRTDACTVFSMYTYLMSWQIAYDSVYVGIRCVACMHVVVCVSYVFAVPCGRMSVFHVHAFGFFLANT